MTLKDTLKDTLKETNIKNNYENDEEDNLEKEDTQKKEESIKELFNIIGYKIKTIDEILVAENNATVFSVIFGNR